MEDLETTESTLENILMRQDEEISLLKMSVEVLERIVMLILEDKLDIATKRFIAEKWKARTSNSHQNQ